MNFNVALENINAAFKKEGLGFEEDKSALFCALCA
jgi:hypothetical protein